jgi:hypothetical protein
MKQLFCEHYKWSDVMDWHNQILDVVRGQLTVYDLGGFRLLVEIEIRQRGAVALVTVARFGDDGHRDEVYRRKDGTGWEFQDFHAWRPQGPFSSDFTNLLERLEKHALEFTTMILDGENPG